MTHATKSYQLALHAFLATDSVELPGLLYEPPKPSNRAAIWLHGMGDNGVFYRPDRVNALGSALTDVGIAFFAFNNRGAHNTKSLRIEDQELPDEDLRYPGGTFYERITDCVHDISGAAKFLQAHGYEELYLIGHSTGANKICAYAARVADNPFHKYVLAGPGDDTGLFYVELGKKKFWRALDYAARCIEQGDPLKIMPMYTGMHPFSAQSAWDILDPEGAYNTFPLYEANHARIGEKKLFEEYSQLDRTTLIIYGDEDTYTDHVGGVQAAIDTFMHYTPNQMLKTTDFRVIPDADHSFTGQEQAFARQVVDWIQHG